MMRSGVADQPERSIQFLRPIPIWSGGLRALLRAFPRFTRNLLVVYRQVAWLLTACNLPARLRTLWRVNAREMTTPTFHRSKRPSKAKSPRPF
jgi:hypothetical protein